MSGQTCRKKSSHNGKSQSTSSRGRKMPVTRSEKDFRRARLCRGRPRGHGQGISLPDPKATRLSEIEQKPIMS